MGRKNRYAVAVLGLGLGFLMGACGSSKTTETKTLDRVCEPGTKSCDGQNVKVCSDDGTERLIVETCPAAQACADGECTDTTCVPNTKFCQDGSVWKCDRSGGGASLYDTCSGSEFCRTEDDTANCVTKSCTPGEALCEGDTATSCAEDGSGPLPDGVDCAANKQTCFEGTCQDVECTPGSKLCQSGDVYLCATNGKDTSLLVDCASGNVCDGGAAACVRQVCKLGELSCDGTRVRKCNTYGSAWEGTDTDCAKDGQLCADGVCKKQICTPSSSFCQDGNVLQCNSNGTQATISQVCSAGFSHCTAYPSANYATCEYNRCQPNQVLCDGNYVKTCNADGSLPADGTDCGAQKYCDSGACKDRICEPGYFSCKDNEVYVCDWQGAYAGYYDQCPPDTLCQAENGSYSCEPLACNPGETSCIGNKIGTCSAKGDALSAVTEDCTTSASICGPDNKCAKSAADTLGTPEDAWLVGSEMLMGDVVEVTSARKLTEMQVSLVLPAARKLRWVVFERSTAGTFTAKKDWVVDNQSGSGYFSSGAISYALKAQTTYLLGVVVHGGNTTTTVVDTAPFDSALSFGKLVAKVDASYSPPTFYVYPDASAVYHMKVTTAP